MKSCAPQSVGSPGTAASENRHDLAASGVTIVERLLAHSTASRERIAFAESNRSLELTRQISFGELGARVLAGAARLRRATSPGDRVLIFFEPGLDPLVAFLAALAARLIAVPLALPAMASATGPRGARRISAAQNILRDCTPCVVLCSPAAQSVITELLDNEEDSIAVYDWADLALHEQEQASGHDFTASLPSMEDVAFLQYTSGSTALPKGVVVTHANIAHYMRGITGFVRTTPESMAVSWLPMFHDMGLVGDALNTIWTGCTCVKLSPTDFLRRPTLWIEAVAKFGGTITGGPNFAFQLAAKHGAPEGKTLDLSTLEICYCGAEPIRREVLDAFILAFAPHGLRPAAVAPCYGLAESTLIVSGRKPRAAVFRTALAPVLPGAADAFVSTAQHEVVSCGRAACDDARVFICDVVTRTALPEGTTGEICVTSRSVSPGYWTDVRKEKTWGFPDMERTLHTGDLGFLIAGDLFICGRLKNTIIAHGRKFLAEDLENLIEHELGASHRTRAAVFSVREGGRECVVALIESSREASETASFPARINRLLAESCGFAPSGPGGFSAAIQNRANTDYICLNAVIDREREAVTQSAVIAKNFAVNTALNGQRVDIFQNGVAKIAAETSSLSLIKSETSK